MPEKVEDPKSIDRPVLVKYHGAKGGRGFFIAKDYPEFKMGIDLSQPYTIQEYVLGTRYYLHFFYSPIKQQGYTVSRGTLELLSMDRRDESNIDEMYKLGASEELKRLGCDFADRRYGELFFLMQPGVLINPSFMGERPIPGMHGYHPEDAQSVAFHATSQAPERPPARLDDLHALMWAEASRAAGIDGEAA